MNSISATGTAAQLGATETNPLIKIDEVFQTNVLPDLSSDVNSVHPIIKVDAIKYVMTFRGKVGSLFSFTRLNWY